MTITRIYADKHGDSHFEDIDIVLNDAGEIGFLSNAIPVKNIIFRRTDPEYDYDWHNAPQSQFILMLDGAVEIEVSDGKKRQFYTGDILLAEDTNGKGHRARCIDGKKRISVFVTLE